MRRGSGRLVEAIIELTAGPGFRSAGLPPLSRAAAVILVGGLRELTAQMVEDGFPVTQMIEPAVAVATALLNGSAVGYYERKRLGESKTFKPRRGNVIDGDLNRPAR